MTNDDFANIDFGKLKINICCSGADSLPLDAIEEFQGKLKKRSKKDEEKIIRSIVEYGFSFPFFVWNGIGHNYCLDGHGRILALAEMRKRGTDLPMFPVVYVDAKDETEAKQKLLRLNSQYGQNSVLSNGEKMRVDLARAILQEQKIIVFDEYTSVVDREVAKIGSLALQNAVHKQDKKFIAVTCHNDVIDWLNPDWTFCTDDMTYHDTRGLLRRPEIKLEIRKLRGYWSMFRRYHYLSSDLSKTSAQYVAFYDNEPVAFCAVINFPHPNIRPMWKIHRIVVLPDYQGIGIGKKLLNFVADKYYPDYIGITTSLNGFAKSLMQDKNWILIHAGRMNANKNIGSLQKSSYSDRNTYSFRYFPKREVAANV